MACSVHSGGTTLVPRADAYVASTFLESLLPASNFVNIATVPEPSACALAAVGFGLAGLTQWRRRWAAENAG
jgi:hypothetical protein